MSKVNDALKRVRDTQQSAPKSADAPSLRSSIPAPAPTPPPGIGLMPIVFVAVAFVGLLGLILHWQLRQREALPPQQPATAKEPAPAPILKQVASVATPRPVLPAAKARTGGPLAPVPTAAAPSAPAIKLQGILYSGPKSSAMISGQTVMAGDDVKGYRVAAIGQRSVTLVNGTQTNVLSLGR